MAIKIKQVKGPLKTYKALQELEKEKSKDVAAKFNLPGSSLHGSKMKKNSKLHHSIKLLNTIVCMEEKYNQAFVTWLPP